MGIDFMLHRVASLGSWGRDEATWQQWFATWECREHPKIAARGFAVTRPNEYGPSRR
jgi:hypothetical protein